MAYKNGKASDSLIGRSTYEKMLASFREHPGNISRTARSAGVSRGTARRAWREGWPSRQLPAIIEVLEEERLLARSRRQAAVVMSGSGGATPGAGGGGPGTDVPAGSSTGFLDELAAEGGATGAEAARALARDDAVATREQEGQMVKLARANAIALMSSTSRLLSAGIDKARELETALKTGTATLTPKETVKFMGSCGYLVSKATESAKLVLEMERLLLGEPTEVIGVAVRDMTLDDAARTIELANRALARARERGLVPAATPDLVDGDVPPADPSALH